MKRELSVLFVEDSEDDALLILNRMEQGGYAPIHTRVYTPDGMEKALTEGRYDLVISDHHLPGFSSKEALGILQATGIDIPFIIVSGLIGEDMAVDAMKAGAHDYLMKDNLIRFLPAIERELREAESRRARKKIEEENIRLAAFPRENPNPVLCADPDGEIIYKNPVVDKYIESLEVELSRFLPLNHADLVASCMEKRQGITEEREVGERIFSWTYSPASSEKIVYLYASEVTLRRRAQERIIHLAFYDELTALPNRVYFMDRLGEAVAGGERDGYDFAVVLLDLDRFNLINDSLGHFHGDELLMQVAERLQRIMGEEDVVSRFGGDEFALLIERVKDREDAQRRVESIDEVFRSPFFLKGLDIFATTSMGIALRSSGYERPEDILRHADMALNEARSHGRNNRSFFTKDMRERVEAKLHLENNLRRTLENGELELYYQPQVDARSGEVVALEALLRWNSPGSGIIPPDSFIPAAEESGLILPIGEWVVRQACRQSVRWQRAGYPPVIMSVNLSPLQFHRSDLASTILRVIDETGLDPSCLELEITEGTIMGQEGGAIAHLTELSRAGVRISIDDFGTGYSSLAYLKRFPIAVIKIDRSFIRDLPGDQDDASITRAIIAMAGSLNLETVAEGVETPEQLELLRSLECDRIQGYYYSPPLPASRIDSLLRKGGGWDIALFQSEAWKEEREDEENPLPTRFSDGKEEGPP